MDAKNDVALDVDTTFREILWANFRYRRGGAGLVLLAVSASAILLAWPRRDLLLSYGRLGFYAVLILCCLILGLCLGNFAAIVQVSLDGRSRRKRDVSHVVFSKDGYAFSNQVTTAEVSWEGVDKVRETSDGFWVFYAPKDFFIVPKRCFASPRDLQTLRNLAKDALGSNAEVQ